MDKGIYVVMHHWSQKEMTYYAELMIFTAGRSLKYTGDKAIKVIILQVFFDFLLIFEIKT